MGIRTAQSKINPRDKVIITQSGSGVPIWAVGVEGVAERITRQGGVVVNVGLSYSRKLITCRSDQVILVKGKNFVPGGKVYDEKGELRNKKEAVSKKSVKAPATTTKKTEKSKPTKKAPAK